MENDAYLLRLTLARLGNDLVSDLKTANSKSSVLTTSQNLLHYTIVSGREEDTYGFLS